MSRRLAEAASRALGRRRPRRGFLAKTAVVGSALAVAPKDFVMKPASAYARVCNCSGSRCNCSKLCCDGYTEFCCTIYGTNGCPPGSLYGGWWKVSASNYCGGSNRYYMDCHQPCKKGCGCGANGVCSGRCNGTKCGCALGSCNNRKAGCTHFRYGQCNRHVKCVGPIICRVVTCTPPWRLDPTCSTASRTDNFTRSHNRACLNDVSSPPLGELEKVTAKAGAIRLRGWAIDTDTTKPIDVHVFVDGKYQVTATADQARPDVGVAYQAFGDAHGFDITLPSSAGRKEVCAQAVNNGEGRNPMIGCERVRVPSAQPTGILEDAVAVDGAIAITGWALVPGDKDPVKVDLYVDDELADRVKANEKRADLKATFGDDGTRHGFAALISAGQADATVCAEITDPDTGDIIKLGCLATKAPSAEPFGAVEKVKGRRGKVRVSGWVIDPDGGKAQVLITVDGVEAKRAKAKLPRPDLVGEVGDFAAEQGGFDVRVAAAAGPRRICVYAVGSDGTVGPLLGCADASVDAPDA